MTNPQKRERRRYVRLDQRHILRHEKYVFSSSPDERSIREGVLKNYSAGGALFESKIKYAIGDVVRLEITIPGWEMYKNEFYRKDKIPHVEPVVVLASVVRVEVFGHVGLYEVGVEFVGIDDGDRWALMKKIRKEVKTA